MVVQNEDLKWSREEQLNLHHKITEDATDYFRESKSGPEEQITYYMNGKWYQLRTNTRLSDRSYHSGRNPGYRNNLFGEAFGEIENPIPIGIRTSCLLISKEKNLMNLLPALQEAVYPLPQKLGRRSVLPAFNKRRYAEF
jgi:hypothetical protein